jgi:hypothetical protein
LQRWRLQQAPAASGSHACITDAPVLFNGSSSLPLLLLSIER